MSEDLMEFLRVVKNTIVEEKLEVDFSNQSLWKEPPVDFCTFCRDWLKEPLFEGPQESFSNDFIGKPDDTQIWDEIKRVALLFWGKGSGKGSISAKLLVYAGYLLKLMVDPRAYFKIGRTAPIHMINVSYNSRQAKQVFFQGYLVPTVLNCINPETKKNFFAEQGMDMRVGEGDILADTIHFERPTKQGEGGISAVSLAGDRGVSIEGYSPLLIFVDEISSMQSPVKAEKLVDDLEKSAQSRFGNFYKLIIASFKQGKNCLMTLKVEEALQKQLADTYVDIASTWSVNRLKRREEFQSIYDKNPVNAARSYECKEVEGADDNVFFKLADKLQASFRSDRENPFDDDVITIPSDQLRSLFFKDGLAPITGCKYHIHIDLAKGTGSDRCGFVMAHREGLESLNSDDLKKYIDGELEDKQFDIKADIILQITASTTQKEIMLSEVRQFVFRLHAMGFRLSVTLDGFQSMDTIQIFNDRGIETEMLSVDRDRKAYDTVQSLVYRGNLHLYEHKILHRELAELEESEDGRKIDHPFKSLHRARYEDGVDFGSKDIADALSGAVLKAVLAPAPKIPIMPSKGKTYHHKDEAVREQLSFEEQVMGKRLIPVEKDRDGAYKRSTSSFVPLMPIR